MYLYCGLYRAVPSYITYLRGVIQLQDIHCHMMAEFHLPALPVGEVSHIGYYHADLPSELNNTRRRSKKVGKNKSSVASNRQERSCCPTMPVSR